MIPDDCIFKDLINVPHVPFLLDVPHSIWRHSVGPWAVHRTSFTRISSMESCCHTHCYTYTQETVLLQGKCKSWTANLFFQTKLHLGYFYVGLQNWTHDKIKMLLEKCILFLKKWEFVEGGRSFKPYHFDLRSVYMSDIVLIHGEWTFSVTVSKMFCSR